VKQVLTASNSRFPISWLTLAEIAEDDYSSLCEAGKTAETMCAGHGLKIRVLQPFANFEGWPEGSRQRQDAFARAKAWIDIMEALGTDML
jgi:sugar phosphate isomerase/epimerase